MWKDQLHGLRIIQASSNHSTDSSQVQQLDDLAEKFDRLSISKAKAPATWIESALIH
jgi:hypothetical protein